MSERFDVIIVGAGPAGIFCARELVRAGGLSVALVEKGLDIAERNRALEQADDVSKYVHLATGWGGAGAYSDGKLTLSSDVGGFLDRYLQKEEILSLVDYVDRVYVEHGAPERIYGEDTTAVEAIAERAARAGLKLIPTRIRHMGSDNCPAILMSFRKELDGKADFIFGTSAETIISSGGKAAGVRLGDGRELSAPFVVLAPGRHGASWLDTEAKRLGINRMVNPVDLGLRVEVPAAVMAPITDVCYEPKFHFWSKSFDDFVRTFCMNPYGEVVQEVHEDLVTVNGHSYSDHKTSRTNFAVLVSTTFTKPFHDPIAYGAYIARLANLLGEGVLVQRLGDLLDGRRSTAERIMKGVVEPSLKSATPGDLSFVLPYRTLKSILEMLEVLDRVAPGVFSRHTLLYGVEVKFYSLWLQLSSALETNIPNLFAVGDGAGVSRGLIQASVSGVVAAREIVRRRSED
jgi:uncharacterized FAD-dependent dehydrogenase